jgi:uncharacterized repeat protein (TIGR01451 family)
VWYWVIRIQLLWWEFLSMKQAHFVVGVAIRLALVLGVTLGAQVMAQGAGAAGSAPVTARLVQKVVSLTPAGKEQLLDADKVKPGDKLEYQLSYSNNSKEAVKGLTATLPVPVGTTFIPGSAAPALLAASLDGVQFSKPPLKRKVEKNGKTIEEDVAPQEYRALRWLVGDLMPDKTITVKARVAVNAAEPASASASAAAVKASGVSAR